jgi:hypothetical protein
MKRALAIVLLAAALIPSAARASWFEFCEIDGQVASVAAESGKNVYSLIVAVMVARRSPQGSLRGYTDCSEHVGNNMEVTLKVPRRKGRPTVGDEITFFRSAIDTFSADGAFAGTSVSFEFRALRKIGSDDEG